MNAPAMTTGAGDRGKRLDSHERFVLALACAGSFLVILDATIVSIALPVIRSDLGFTSAALPWVVNAYTLVFAGFLLLGGRFSDVFGRRRVMLAGLGVFTVARFVSGLAGSPELLLIARALQGFGAALLMPVTLSLLTTTFTDEARRTRALGTWSAVGAIGAASGPVIGGVLTQWAGWRWVFFVSVPVGVLAMIGAARMLRSPRTSGVRPRLDLTGAALATTGLVGIVYAVMRSALVEWTSPDVAGPLVVGLVLLGCFVLHQARWARDPLVPPGILRLRAVVSGNVVMFLLGLGFFASPILLSLYLQDVHGFSPLQAGLGYLPVGIAMFAGAQTAGALTVRFGPRRAAVFGCLLGALGFAGVAALIGVHSSYVVSVVLPGVVFGFGTTSAFTPITVAATHGVPPHLNGLAAGLLNSVRQTSGAMGLAMLSTVSAAVAASWAAAPGSATAISPEALAHGYAVAFAVSAGCVGLAALLAATAMSREPR